LIFLLTKETASILAILPVLSQSKGLSRAMSREAMSKGKIYPQMNAD